MFKNWSIALRFLGFYVTKQSFIFSFSFPYINCLIFLLYVNSATSVILDCQHEQFTSTGIFDLLQIYTSCKLLMVQLIMFMIYILQTLFSGTVAANIGYRDLTTKIDMDRVKHASEIAHADKFGKNYQKDTKSILDQGGQL